MNVWYCCFITALMASVAFAQQRSLQQDWEFEPNGSEANMSLEVPEPGLIWIQPLDVPETFDFLAEILSAESRDRTKMEFRVPKGKQELKIWERTGREAPGKVKFRVHFVPENDPSEPENDRSTRPRDVSIGENIPLRLFPTGEVDFIRVSPGKRGYIFVTTPNPPEGFNLWPEMADTSGNSLGLSSGHTPTGGPITIRIADRWGAFGSLDPFPLSIRFVPEMDFAEPNNSIPEAVDTVLGNWHEAALMPEADVDHFRFQTQEPGYVQIRVYERPEFKIDWEIVDPNSGLPVADGWILPLPKGDFVLRLKAEDPTQYSEKPFRFQIVWRSIRRISPRHSRASEATEVDAGRSHSVRIASANEEDHLAVRVNQPSVIWFQGTLPAELNGVFKTGGGRTGNPLWLRDDRGIVTASFTEETGDYTVEPATIWTDVVPDLDPNEPNDSRDVRKPLELGRPQPLYLYPDNDLDWFAFRLRHPASLQVRILSPGGNLGDFTQGVEFGITDDQGLPVAQRIGTATSGRSWVAAPVDLPRGKFNIWVKGRWGGSSPHPLQILAFPLDDIPEAISEAGIQVVALGTGESVTALRAVTEAAGAEFIQPAIDPANVAITPTLANQTAESGGTRWWLWILGGLVLFWLIKKMAKPRRRRPKISSLTG